MADVNESPDVLFGQELATALVMFEEAVASNLDLNATDYRSLVTILKTPEINPKILSEKIGLTTGAVTGIIDNLEKKGFVTRKRNPDDRRQIIIIPLLSYQDLNKKISPIFESLGARMGELFSHYTEDQIKTILGFLGNFVEIIKSETLKLKK